MATLNFNTTKKQYLNVILPDEKNTTLLISMPTKSLFTELDSIKNNFSNLKTNESLDSALNELYDLVARIMSRNKGGIEITTERLENCLDFEDVVLFLNSYLAFINNVQASKN